MKSKITYSPYQNHYAPALASIIKKTWHYERFCSQRVAKLMSNAYLSSCLASQTYTMTAFMDDKPVGIIMANSKAGHKQTFRTIWRQLTSAIPLLRTKEGRATTKIFKEINDLNLSLLAKQNKAYDGEIVFFAVSEDCRNTGIGRVLFQMALEYMKNQQMKSYYLYTDSSCNYGFYEHLGLVRCQEFSCKLPVNLDDDMKFYLYEGAL